MMIKDEATAKRALALIESAHALLMDSLHVVRESCCDEEYKEYRAGIGHVLARLFFEVMEPIYQQHPVLAPKDTPKEFLKSWIRKAPDE